MDGPLKGIRVLDWTLAQQGPVATMMLGDLGADVIKIEHPVNGDRGRTYLLHGVRRDPGGRNFYFEANNRNKRAIALDFKKEEAREILYRLVEKSDVFVQNWRKGVAARLGVDYPALSRYNPRLIYASANTFGPEGPESEKPGNDAMGLARSGIMLSMGHPDWPPVHPQAGLADQTGAVMMALGILAALVARGQSGVGQELNSSLMGSMISLQGLNVMSCLILGTEYGRRDRKDARNPLYNHYECADGKWICLAITRENKFWHDFCHAMGLEELENDPRFNSEDKRRDNNRELVSILDRLFATRPRSEWLKMLNPELQHTYISTIEDLAGDHQVLQNNYIIEFNHPVWGKIKEVGFPVAFSKTPASLRRAAPMQGEHTEEILMEVLGHTREDIERLKERKVI